MSTKLNNKKIEKYLFIVSMIITSLLGLILTYNFEFNNNLNLLFDSDTARVIGDASSYFYKHYRSIVHPLYILIIQPLCFILNGITMNRMISLVFISSLSTSITVLYIYKILNTIKNNPKQNLIISLIYLFSFGNIIFTSGIEVYNIAVMFIVLLWYYYIIKRNKSFDKYSYIILILLGISTAAITITNFIIFFIILGLLFITKKIDIKKTIIISIVTVLGLLSLNIIQHFIWRSAPLFWQKEIKSETDYVSYKSIGIKNLNNVVKNNYYNSLISNNVEVKVSKKFFYMGDNYVLTFNNTNYLSIFIISILYIFTIILIIRNIKKDLFLNLGLLATLLFNTVLHILYGNNSTYLYSLHFIYLIILLLGINLSYEKNIKLKKIINIFLVIFLLFEICINTYYFQKIIKMINEIVKSNVLVQKFGLLKTIGIELILVLLVTILVITIYKIIRKIDKKNSKEKNILLIISIIGLIIGIESMFSLIHNYQIKDNYKSETINVDNYIDVKDKTNYLENDFKKYYKKELESLKIYKNEYIKFVKEYAPDTNNTLNESVCFYMGFASRRKLIYKPGLVVDIGTGEVLYEFEEEEAMIIPNIYTVIIKTKDNKFIKIFEDNDGIHYSVNGKDKIIEGTDIKLNLYDFSNQEYSNMKKVLYGEILFNIKDSKIYPNIVAYKTPWYRDAAITSMVLRQTNNTDLIKEWINNINDIYDGNNGENEPDNLGEVLYLLSLQEEKNNELIDRIEEEAKRLAEENPNGYYIYGKTDFSDQHLYQNLWYKLGIESVGRDFEFDIDSIPEDEYSKGAWWSSYQTKNYYNDNSNPEYPYLSYAIRHKQKQGKITISKELYPLSWETNGKYADYELYTGFDRSMRDMATSPLHTWSASELLLFIMDETNNLDYDKLK